MTAPDRKVIHLHRGYVSPRRHTGSELSRLVGDPDAVFAREPVDLEQWLNRPRKRFGFPPPINWIDLFAKAIIVAGAGVCVAMWMGAV